MSHWAASTEKFAGECADCIAAFALDDDAKGSLRCSTVEQSEVRTHHMAEPPAAGASDAPG